MAWMPGTDVSKVGDNWGKASREALVQLVAGSVGLRAARANSN